MRLVFLGSDILLFILLLALILFAINSGRQAHLRRPWKTVIWRPLGLCSTMILILFFTIAVLDSIHFRAALPQTGNGKTVYSTTVTSLLDSLLKPIGQHSEKTYSAPFASHLYTKQSQHLAQGEIIRTYLPLQHKIKLTPEQRDEDILYRITLALLISFIGTTGLLLFSGGIIRWRQGTKVLTSLKQMLLGQTHFPWRTLAITLFVILFVILLTALLASNYYVMGTGKVGQDVLYEAIKSIRTGILIGTLTTLVMLPFAIIFGMMAGYFGGIVDDIIQYLYTTLSSIPGVLLIAAAILSIQVYIANHPQMFPSISARADARLLALCLVLGITSWTSLCRVLRAETLKLRELDYIHSAKLLGSNWWRILTKHVLPNITHIILITVVLDFSGLVLAEAVLTYVGVGVDPTTLSWGNMIDGARLELAREPIVWWPLASAFAFMFIFILAANLFADSVRDAFDPRTHINSN